MILHAEFMNYRILTESYMNLAFMKFYYNELYKQIDLETVEIYRFR